jgi:hypothetical protein
MTRYGFSAPQLTRSLPMALWSLKYFPRTKGEEANVSDKWKRLDLIGCITYVLSPLHRLLLLTLSD